MTKAYIPTNGSLSELKAVIQTVQQLGLDKQNTYVGGSFDSFSQNLTKGDTALVHSLTIFNSITQILSKTTQLKENGVELLSISEPWFNNPETTSQELLQHLFKLAATIHAPIDTEPKIALSLKHTSIIEKVRNAKRLSQEHKISLAKACKMSKCTLSAYYTYVKKIDL